MAGALQELSDGRLILGIGAGNQIHEHTAFDVGFERRVGRFKEYLAIMTALMNGEDSHDGRPPLHLARGDFAHVCPEK